MQEIDELLQAISALEAQRPVLGDGVVDAALMPLREKLARLEGRESVTQQRRMVTVLFTDIDNSTLISQRREPEEVMEIIDGALKRLSAPITTHGGQVIRYMGDGFLAVFGLSHVRENDALQAVRAGLAILNESHAYADEMHQAFQVPRFTIRIGINTGRVAAGGFSEAESTIMGLTVSLAKRIEELAQPNCVYISQFTHQHIRGAFDVQVLPPIKVKGFPKRIKVYKICAARPRTFRTVTRGVEGIETRLIGREAELKQLQEVLTHSIQSRETTLMTIIGEAGVGKSRLLYEFDRWVAQLLTPVIAFKARSAPQMTTTPFGMLRDVLCYRLSVLTTDPVGKTRQRLTQELAEYLIDEPEVKADFVGSLLGFDFSFSPHLQGVENNPKQLRERAQIYLTEYIAAVAAKNATIVMLDDIHWSDELSLSFVLHLVREYPHLPLLVLSLARPSLVDRFPQWGGELPKGDQSGKPEPLPTSLWLELGALTNQSSLDLLYEILGSAGALPDGMRDQILSRADGNPFYLEEFVQELVDIKAIYRRGRGGRWKLNLSKLVQLEVPDTLTLLLEARLDSLNTADKALLQQASVIGPVFWRSALEALREGNPISEAQLECLIRRGFIHLRESSNFSGTDEYHFHHGLLRDVAYQTLLKTERQGYHARTAAWLIDATQSAGRAGEFAPIIADHYDSAGESMLAVDWYTQSGYRSRNQGAPYQARTFFDHALVLLSREAGKTPANIDLRRHWQALAGRDEVLGILGETEKRMDDDIALVALAKEIGEDGLIAEAYYRQGHFLGVGGRYQQEHDAYLQGLEAARRANDKSREALILGMKVVCELRLGDLQTAGQTARMAIAQAEEVKDDDVLVRCLTNAAAYYIESGDVAEAAQLLDRQLTINRSAGNIEGEMAGLLNLGYDYIMLGMAQEGISALQRCKELAKLIGNRSYNAFASLNLALAYVRIGNPQAALDELNQSLPELLAMNDLFGHAVGQVYAALAFELIGSLSEALTNYEQAASTLDEIGMQGNVSDAEAGIARCRVVMNDLEIAQQAVIRVWNYLQQKDGAGMELPILAFETCANVFSALGQTHLAQQAIEAGYNELITRAERINPPEWRRSFLERVPEHHRIQLRWIESTKTNHVPEGE